MEDRETARMRKYVESKMTRIMKATVPHVTSGWGLRKFQADGFLLTRVYKANTCTTQYIYIYTHIYYTYSAVTPAQNATLCHTSHDTWTGSITGQDRGSGYLYAAVR